MATFPGFGRTFDFAAKAIASNPKTKILEPLFRQARLFCFPHDPPTVLPKVIDNTAFWKESFALPYPVTAIEDTGGMTLLWDCPLLNDVEGGMDLMRVGPFSVERVAQSVSDRPLRGLEPARMALDILPSWSKLLDLLTEEQKREMRVGKYFNSFASGEHIVITLGAAGIADIDPEGRKYLMGGSTCRSWLMNKNELMWYGDESEDLSGMDNTFLKNARCAFEEIMWFSNPDRFVVEQTRTDEVRPPNRKGKVKNHKERPTYHSWTPLDIRRVRELGDTILDTHGDPIKRRGHWRRGHFRTLRADRYARSGMQGKTVLVRPAFIGDENFTVKRDHYRVLLGENEVLVGQQQTSQEAAQ